MRVWAVANQKGGVGKTTTTINVGGLLAQSGRRVLLVDLDPHGSLTSYLQLDPETIEKSVYHLFEQASDGVELNADDIIQPTQLENISILPASTAVATLERQLGSRSGMGLVLKQVLETVQHDYDNVLIDCPPMMGLLMINALAACKRVIIPVQTEHLAIKGMQRMLRTMQMIQQSLNIDIAYTVLPTMYDRRTVACRQSLQQLQQDFHEKLSRVIVPIDTRLRDASHKGLPLCQLNTESQGLQAYKRFTQMLAGSQQAPVK